MTKKEFRNNLKKEYQYNFQNYNKLKIIKMFLCKDISFQIWKFIKLLRICEFFKSKKSILSSIKYYLYRRRKNKLGIKLNLEIYEYSLGFCCKIHHIGGGIVINGSAKVGDYSVLRGNNCIGANSIGKTPILGNYVDIGYGTIIIGDVHIGDSVTIGAGAVVTKSFEDNTIIAGVPAKIVH